GRQSTRLGSGTGAREAQTRRPPRGGGGLTASAGTPAPGSRPAGRGTAGGGAAILAAASTRAACGSRDVFPAGARRRGGAGRAAAAGAGGAGAAAAPGAEAAATRRAAAAAAQTPRVLEDETKPEDCIPDVPGNEHAREFLAHAPTKGLWMPLGKEVKVMQCWRCKRYGHRTGDKECPFFIKGNQKLEQFRVAHEDPMYDIIRENKRHEKDVRIQQLKQLLEDSTSDEDGSSSSSSECKEKHKKKKKKEKHKKRKKEKKKKKKRKHKSSKSSESSDSD
uniref:Retinitis pigmentosa 9 protein n=3 Tax=Boreoeutheria TaxID=1437010 RepID=A0A8D2HFQ3_UROPR